MRRHLAHRGPDREGIWVRGPAVLGHRRLAIIDREGGHQPLLNESGNVGVVFNGEIYNFRELRQQLGSAGHRFATSSDTEVLVHGYEEWGDEVVTRLRGMFAFAIWDHPRRRLLLARDRLGVKPLYLYEDPRRERVLFASEIKALFADPSVPRALNAPRLTEYLTFRSIAGEETLFAGIRELEPGHLAIYTEGRRTVRRYWSPEVAPTDDVGDHVGQGRELLQDAVAVRLVSDVKLGTIVSGGLDSSLVSAIAARCSAAGPIDTFCVGFADTRYDERPFAREVARDIGSRHHEIVVSPEQIDRELDRLTWAHDEPLTHPNSVPMHLIFRHAKERVGVTVLLSGEGADEVFGGYEWYRTALLRERLGRMPGLSLLARAAPIGKLATLRRILAPEYLLAANATARGDAVDRLLSDALDPLLNRRRAWPASRSGADGLFIYDQRSYLLPLLQRQDRMSMAAGLEARVPFLDHHLVEWANGMHARAKLSSGVRKGLLKEMAGNWLSPRIIHRRKVGFAMPIGTWMRRGGPLARRVGRLRDPSSPLHAVLRSDGIDRLVQEHDGGADHTDLLWSLVALESWFEVFLSGRVHGQTLPGVDTRRLRGRAPMMPPAVP